MFSSRALFLLASAFVFVTARATGQEYERIDVNDQGQPGNAGVWAAGEISDDGRFVVFITDATNFGGPDAASTRDVFVRDRTLHTTTRITSSLNTLDQHQYRLAVISGDGSTIAFGQSTNGPLGPFRSFVHVLATHTTTEILVPNFSDVIVDALSLDGRFASVTARTITDQTQQVYRLDLTNGGLILCSSSPGGVPAGGRASDIDDDGTHVVFDSASPLIVPGDTNGTPDVFVFDIPGNTFIRASVATNGEQANNMSRQGSITGDGRFVSMWSMASNLMPGATGAVVEVYLRDTRLGTTTPVSLNTQQRPTVHSLQAHSYPADDASSVAFMSLYPTVGSSRVDLQACKLEYSIVSPK